MADIKIEAEDDAEVKIEEVTSETVEENAEEIPVDPSTDKTDVAAANAQVAEAAARQATMAAEAATAIAKTEAAISIAESEDERAWLKQRLTEQQAEMAELRQEIAALQSRMETFSTPPASQQPEAPMEVTEPESLSESAGDRPEAVTEILPEPEAPKSRRKVRRYI